MPDVKKERLNEYGLTEKEVDIIMADRAFQYTMKK